MGSATREISDCCWVKALRFFAFRVRKLANVVTPTLQLAPGRNVEEEYQIRSFDNLQEALAENPEIAVICNPSNMHVPAALECARAGCDLFIEKPLSNGVEGVAELIDEVESRGRIAMVGYQLRFHPCFLRLREILQQEALGNLLAVRATVGNICRAGIAMRITGKCTRRVPTWEVA